MDIQVMRDWARRLDKLAVQMDGVLPEGLPAQAIRAGLDELLLHPLVALERAFPAVMVGLETLGECLGWAVRTVPRGPG